MVLSEFLKEWEAPSEYVRVQTSGSTGTPKQMLVEKRRMLASARMTCDFLGLCAADTALLCMNLDYIGAKMMVVRSLERGMRLVTVPPSGHPVAELSQEFRKPGSVQFAAMVPLQVYNTLQAEDEVAWLRTIRHLIIGGGAVDDALVKALRDFPHSVWSTYGMTETLSHIALRKINGDDADDSYTPFDGIHVSTDDEGRLVIDAPMLHEGLLVTNDLAEVQPDGRFRILGRRDNVIVSGGVKIRIEEIEQILKRELAYPVMITKVKDSKFGEAVVLLTVADDLVTVERVCQAVLHKYQQPKHYIRVAELPLTPTGKPARAKAQQMAESLLGFGESTTSL